MTAAQDHFRAVSPAYMRKLLADFPAFDKLDAAAVFGNLGHESNGLATLQEISPTVKGSRGGYGWAQWTGPRRVAYEAYCARNKLNPAADASNYAYLFVELTGDEKRAVGATCAADTLDDKVTAFERSFLRAGTPHYDSRKAWARIALAAYEQAIAAAAPPAQIPPAAPAQQPPTPHHEPEKQGLTLVGWCVVGALMTIALAMAVALIYRSM